MIEHMRMFSLEHGGVATLTSSRRSDAMRSSRLNMVALQHALLKKVGLD